MSATELQAFPGHIGQYQQAPMRLSPHVVTFVVVLSSGLIPAGAQTNDPLPDTARVAFSHGDKSTSVGEILLDDLSIALSDGGTFFTAPLRFSGKDWVLAGSFAGATVGLFAIDEDVRKAIGRETAATLNNDFWDIPTRYGVVAYANMFGAATYATGLLIRNDDIRITGRLLLESLSFSGLSVITVRALAGRSRPYSGDGPWKFNGFTLDNEIQSFPSGHTTVAFGMSTILAERIGTWWSRMFFYGMASLTAYARVLNNQHWLSDVVVGAAFGLGAGLFVLQREYERSSNEMPTQACLVLQPWRNGIKVLYLF